jgi:hypothetical protein
VGERWSGWRRWSPWTLLVGTAIAAGALLWLGGAAEVLLEDPAPDGPECWEFPSTESSTPAVGSETARWFGGGVLGRPGLTCRLEFGDFAGIPGGARGAGVMDEMADGSVEYQQLTGFDLIAALAAGIVLVSGVVLAAESVRHRRHADR